MLYDTPDASSGLFYINIKLVKDDCSCFEKSNSLGLISANLLQNLSFDFKLLERVKLPPYCLSLLPTAKTRNLSSTKLSSTSFNFLRICDSIYREVGLSTLLFRAIPNHRSGSSNHTAYKAISKTLRGV